MRVAIVAHGRFHAFDLALALIRRGHDVKVFTNYPKWAAKRFGLPSAVVESFWVHGVLARIVNRLTSRMARKPLTAALHTSFGSWAARRVSAGSWDVIHMFTGVAEETLRLRFPPQTLRQLVRGSAHIRTQQSILLAESQRCGYRIDQPEPWMVEREEREYGLADRIVVLSRFAYRSFLREGVPEERLRLLPLGVDTAGFRAEEQVLDNRRRHIRSGRPLRVLMVGTLSYRKGLYDLERVVRRLRGARFRFRFVGDIAAEARRAASALHGLIEMVPRQAHQQLRRWYSDADLFLLPTVEDGYAVVLSQAQANALPIVATTNCCAPDIVVEGQTGWVVPIRDPDAIVERLLWCDSHREEMAAMVTRIANEFQPRNWDHVAADFEALVADSISEVPAEDNGR